MKHLHWDFAHWELGNRIKRFDSADISTFAILGAAVALILLMVASLFFNAPPMQSDVLLYHP